MVNMVLGADTCKTLRLAAFKHYGLGRLAEGPPSLCLLWVDEIRKGWPKVRLRVRLLSLGARNEPTT